MRKHRHKVGDRVMFKAPPEFEHYEKWQAANGSAGIVTEVGADGISVYLDEPNPAANWPNRELGASRPDCWVPAGPAKFSSITEVEQFLNEETA